MPSFSLETIDLFILCRAIGLLGFSIYVIGFFCLCTGRLSSSTPAYFLLTFIAASCVMMSLIVEFNLSAALIQLFYIVMSLGGVISRLSHRKRLTQQSKELLAQESNHAVNRLDHAA
jgi:predicted membrane protein